MKLSHAGPQPATTSYLKTLCFDYPEGTHRGVGLTPATWMKYREDLEQIVLAHPSLFPDYRKADGLS